MEDKEKYGMIETIGGVSAVIGYAVSPLPKLVRGLCETIPESISLAGDFIDVFESQKQYDEKIQDEKVKEKKQSETKETKQLDQTSAQPSISRAEKLKQNLDDVQRIGAAPRSKDPYTETLVNKPIDMRSEIMEKTKSYAGKLFGSEKIQKEAEMQSNPQYTKNYNIKEKIESGAVRETNKINDELTEASPEKKQELIERKNEVAQLFKDSDALTTDKIYQGIENREYTSVLQKADELGISAPNYSMYGTGGIIVGGMVAAYLGARLGKSLDKAVYTAVDITRTSYDLIKKLVSGSITLGSLLHKTLKRKKNSHLEDKISDIEKINFQISIGPGEWPKEDEHKQN